jgi:Protein of unknown function (DUF3085)
MELKMKRAIVRHTGLTFPVGRVLAAVTEAYRGPNPCTLYGVGTGPGLWLVGDEGVYLMPNTNAKPRTIVYARECDPTKLPFDTWWENKQATFGGGDGIEFIAAKDLMKDLREFNKQHGAPCFFHVEITPDKFATGFLRRARK